VPDARQRARLGHVVRRREQGEELLREGADAVICSADESIGERVRALTDGAGVPFALDAVGGATGSEVVKTLAPGGRMLVYGTLSFEPLSIDPRTLIVGQKRVEGFWLGQWIAQQGLLTKLRLVRTIGRLMSAGVLTSPVSAIYPMEKIHEAVRAAAQPGRPGKIMLRISPA